MKRCRRCKQTPCAPPVLEPYAKTPQGRDVVRCHACGGLFEMTWRGPRITDAAHTHAPPSRGRAGCELESGWPDVLTHRLAVRCPQPMTSLAEITVQDADGRDVRLGELIHRPTVIVVPRYYGCLPCRDYLQQVSDRLDELEAHGAAAVGISVGAVHQARWLMEERRIRFPLLVDPERRFYDAIDLPKKWWVGLNPRGWVNYARAIRRGSRQGRIVSPNQLPGLVVVDQDARSRAIHRGKALGDYPPFEVVLGELGRATEPAPA